jgi:hypothetical protein
VSGGPARRRTLAADVRRELPVRRQHVRHLPAAPGGCGGAARHAHLEPALRPRRGRGPHQQQPGGARAAGQRRPVGGLRHPAPGRQLLGLSGAPHRSHGLGGPEHAPQLDPGPRGGLPAARPVGPRSAPRPPVPADRRRALHRARLRAGGGRRRQPRRRPRSCRSWASSGHGPPTCGGAPTGT